MPNFGFIEKILQYLQTIPGQRVTPTQVAEATRVKRDVAVGSLYRLAQKKIGVERPEGGIYVYNPPKSGEARPAEPKPDRSKKPTETAEYLLLKIVADTKDGWKVAIEEETGKAYRLEGL